MSDNNHDEPDDTRVKVEAKIKAFDEQMQRSLPPGLNSPLSKSERALLRTFYLFILASRSPRDLP